MTNLVTRTRNSFFSFLLIISGISFFLYPSIRPFSDETSLQGATAFASVEWLISHLLAILAFTLLPVSFLGVYRSLEDKFVKSIAFVALILSILSIGLILPFYGGEVYGLHALGKGALMEKLTDMSFLATIIRSGPGLILFLIGLLVLAVTSIILSVALWRSRIYSKWSGIPFVVGISLFIPQFFWDQPLRVAHGLLVALGCIWIAVEMARHGKRVSE